MDQSPSRADEALRVVSRVGVIGDIHTAFTMLEWALDVLAAQRVELVLATGDIADGPEQAQGVIRCCKLLRQARALPILGNHDRWMLDCVMRDFPDATFLDELDHETRDYLRSLPPTREFETPGGRLLFGHGLGADDMATLYPHDRGAELANNAALQQVIRENRHRYVLGGHTHKRLVRNIGGITFINAGAIAATREPCCLVLDFGEASAQYHDYEAGKTVPGPRFEL